MATIIEDYTPITQGDTGAFFAPTFQYGNGQPVDLTGASISMKMVFEETGITKSCTGLWSIDNAEAGQAHYQWQANDVSLPGAWTLSIVVTLLAGPVHADSKPLTILPAP